MTEAQVKVLDAALAWWESRRPLSHTYGMHLKNPTINCCQGEAEKMLARAVAEWLKAHA